MQPCTCESRLAGFRMGPHSKASQISATSMRPFERSSLTSTQAATTESFSVPQARPTPRSGVTCLRRALQPNSFAALSSTARSRGFSRWASRNSRGSAPAAAASSSMKDSRAKLLAVAPRHRYEPWGSGESEPTEETLAFGIA